MEDFKGTCNQLGCKHVFHLICICKWMTANLERKCPLCSQVFLAKDNSETGDILGFLDVIGTGQQSDFGVREI